MEADRALAAMLLVRGQPFPHEDPKDGQMILVEIKGVRCVGPNKVIIALGEPGKLAGSRPSPGRQNEIRIDSSKSKNVPGKRRKRKVVMVRDLDVRRRGTSGSRLH